MKIHNLEQQSPEWFEIRKLKMTASHAQAIGNVGKGLETYITELVAEYLSSGDKLGFSNNHTDRGNELETLARQIYELETGNEVETVGFIEADLYSGCSPDGLVGKDGGLEIKCPDDVGFYKMLRGDEPDSKYVWQVQMNLLLTKRKWWDLVFYNPNFKQGFVKFRIEPDKEKQEALTEGLRVGAEMITEQLAKFNDK